MFRGEELAPRWSTDVDAGGPLENGVEIVGGEVAQAATNVEAPSTTPHISSTQVLASFPVLGVLLSKVSPVDVRVVLLAI